MGLELIRYSGDSGFDGVDGIFVMGGDVDIVKFDM